MKNTTKTIAVVLALFLVAACFVGSAAAVRTVVTGDDAFVYEQIDYAGIATTDKLVKFSGDSTPVALNTIPASTVAGATYFDLLEGAVGTSTGTYYLNAYGNAFTVNIWYPEMTLKAYLGTSYDSIEGKTINKLTDVRFVIEAPKVGPATGTPGLVAPVRIVFTTPVGGKTTDFGNGQFDATSLGGFNGAVQLIAPLAAPQTSDAAGTYVAQAEFTNSDFIGIPDKYKKSNTISFTVQSTSLTLTANKDSVVRSNPFTVTIQGQSQYVYFVYLDGATESDVNPTLQDGQSGMKGHLLAFADNLNVPTNSAGTYLFQMSSAASTLQGTSAYFATDASGKRTVQYNTNADTEDKTYTIKVYDIADESTFVFGPNQYGTDNDKVKVKVEKGAVTITASGDRSYYIGEEIKLTGTNTDSSDVFLFITGPNLLSDGQMLTQLPIQTTADTARINDVTVKTDNTWEYKWDTSNCGLDTGAYTIYATSVLTNGKSSGAGVNGVKLSDSEYATISVNLKQPFLSATPSGTTVAKGDKIYIRGTAEGDPSTLKLYIFGPNYFTTESITVEDDGSYEKKLDINSDMSSNQYYVVIEHPMYNGKIDVDDTGSASNPRVLSIANNAGGEQASFIVWGTNKLQGSNAADALTKMIDSANIDDIYTKLTFTVAEPWIKINNPGDQATGTTFTISGTTNLAVDDQILIEVVSSSFNAIDKTSTSTTSGFSQTTKVVAGDGTDNAWSIEVDTTNFKLDEYTIKAQGIETDVTTTTNFNLVEKVNPTVTPTATVTGQPTTTATTAVPTDAPKTPGFGAFIALAGLGAVALLVLRRN